VRFGLQNSDLRNIWAYDFWGIWNFRNCAAARSDYGCPTRIRFLEGVNDFWLLT
jgi:hypothetical protein